MRVSGIRHPRTKFFFGAACGLVALGGVVAITANDQRNASDPLLVAVFGALILLGFAFIDRRIDDERADAALERRGVRATATVNQFTEVRDREGDIMGWTAEITYRADGPYVARFHIPIDRRHGLEVGSLVNIRYDPEHPETVGWLA
jgi:hypothetical protein